MNNQMFKKRGFTLIELMIVISVIALLMMVLFPKVGILQNKTKEMGVRANALMLESIIYSMIYDYEATEGDIYGFEYKIHGEIEAPEASQQIKNPITGAIGVIDQPHIESGGAFVYDDTQLLSAVLEACWPDTYPEAEGMVVYAIYENNNKVTVDIIPYGAGGKKLTKWVKTISQ